MRNDFIKELKKYIEIDEYGSCATKEAKIRIPPRGSDSSAMKEFYSNFKFILAVENTDSDGYVSEKIFNSLGSVSVPVYLGARNIKEFPKLDAKGTDWFIDARDFKTVKSLAEHMKKISVNETLHRSYLQWQKYANEGGIWMPNAPENMKSCFKKMEGPPKILNSLIYRHMVICELCDDVFLEKLAKRGFEAIEMTRHPSIFEDM